jgi:hypothetical protein
VNLIFRHLYKKILHLLINFFIDYIIILFIKIKKMNRQDDLDILSIYSNSERRKVKELCINSMYFIF